MNDTLRRQIIDTALAMNARGVNQGKSGNVSARAGEGFLVTPSAIPYDRLAPEDVVFMREGGRHEGPGKPSTEWRIHRDLYHARPEANAVIHAHPPFCTALACHRRGIPAFHYMVAIAGGDDIRCADYATFGTDALSKHVIAALRDRDACLMANHGMVALGADLESALALAVEVEALAAQYLRALTLGEPQRLSAAEMDEVKARFRDYRSANGFRRTAPNPDVSATSPPATARSEEVR